MRTGSIKDSEARRFACTACGRCCDRGPEIELSEATALAGTFVTSLVFKTPSIPLSDRTERAAQWWREQGSRIPLRAALEEKRRHLALFASRRRSQRRNEREVYLTISAIVDDYAAGKCPALTDNRCGIYDHRPLTCRTVPLHYSRPPSVLRNYVDGFTATPGYECDIVASPVVLNGNSVVSPEIRRDRERAVEVAKADRGWKEHLLALMDDPRSAERTGLPTYDAVLNNSDNGYATVLPMIVAWRVAEHAGIISQADLENICDRQVALIGAELAKSPLAQGLRDVLSLYEAGAAGKGRLGHLPALAGAATSG